jgi:hypothetical protein
MKSREHCEDGQRGPAKIAMDMSIVLNIYGRSSAGSEEDHVDV